MRGRSGSCALSYANDFLHNQVARFFAQHEEAKREYDAFFDAQKKQQEVAEVELQQHLHQVLVNSAAGGRRAGCRLEHPNGRASSGAIMTSASSTLWPTSASSSCNNAVQMNNDTHTGDQNIFQPPQHLLLAASTYRMKKVLQLHMCWNFSITKLLCMSRKTWDAQTIRENTNEMKLAGISCMTEVVCLACLASECVIVTLFSHDTSPSGSTTAAAPTPSPLQQLSVRNTGELRREVENIEPVGLNMRPQLAISRVEARRGHLCENDEALRVDSSIGTTTARATTSTARTAASCSSGDEQLGVPAASSEQVVVTRTSARAEQTTGPSSTTTLKTSLKRPRDVVGAAPLILGTSSSAETKSGDEPPQQQLLGGKGKNEFGSKNTARTADEVNKDALKKFKRYAS